jgi:hypothetical protein
MTVPAPNSKAEKKNQRAAAATDIARCAPAAALS